MQLTRSPGQGFQYGPYCVHFLLTLLFRSFTHVQTSLSRALYNLDLGDFADDATDEFIGDESYAQEESLAESSKRKLMGHSRRSAGGGADLSCWLCDAPWEKS